jgi:transposase
MTLIQSAKINGFDLQTYLKGLMEKMSKHRASNIGQLLPHNGQF